MGAIQRMERDTDLLCDVPSALDINPFIKPNMSGMTMACSCYLALSTLNESKNLGGLSQVPQTGNKALKGQSEALAGTPCRCVDVSIRKQFRCLYYYNLTSLWDTNDIFIMVRHIAQVILCLIVAQGAADSDAIRRRRRGVLEVDHQESAAEILASLWEKDGINPDQRSLAKKGMMDGKGGKGGKGKGGKGKEDKGKGGKGGKSEDMSFYYF